jgi:cystathionine gamma-lyase
MPDAPGTRVVRAGLPEEGDEVPFLPGPTFVAPYRLAGEVEGRRYGYGRFANPTWTAYEAALGELEGGDAVCFSSGMAAVSAVLFSTLSAGDVLVAPSDGYPGVRELANGPLARLGVEARLVRSLDDAYLDALAGARLVLVESPSNPRLDVLDLPAIAEAAHTQGAIVGVDNTLITPLGQRPLEVGADVSISSATKHLSGHSDIVLGYAAARDPELVAALLKWRGDAGAIPGPFETWLAHRSLATLDVRLTRQEENALALAELLAFSDAVLDVRYPGLGSDPSHARAVERLDRFGSVVAFTLRDAAAVERFFATTHLVDEATSFGGVHTTAERRGRWGTDDVPEGFVRLSAGIEVTADLVADVGRGLEAAGPASAV